MSGLRFQLRRLAMLLPILVAGFALTVFIPVVLIVGLYASNWGQQLGAVESSSCSVWHGKLVAPGAINDFSKTSTDAIIDSHSSSCRSKLDQALLYGSHKVPCYISASGDRLASAPIESYVSWFLALFYLPFLIFSLPIMLRLVLRVWRAKNIEQLQVNALYDERARKRAPFFGVVFPAVILLMTRSVSIVVSDVENFLSRNWTVSQCKVIEACKASAKYERGGIVYERSIGDTIFRSSSFNGLRLNDSATPTRLQDLEASQQDYLALSPGSQINCYVNPANQAQMKLRPDQAWSAKPYIVELIFAGFVAVVLFCIMWFGYRRKKSGRSCSVETFPK